MKILDGKGKGIAAQVDSSNRLRTHAVTKSEGLHSSEEGNGYNINTGLITSVNGNASLLYIKNNETKDLVIESIIVGIFEGITHSDDPYMSIIRNPTGGDIISDATAVQSNVNRNFASNNVLVADVFKGKVSGTVTGGSTLGIFQLTPATRTVIPVNLILPKGTSVGLTLTANVGSGSASVYAAAFTYLKEDTTD